MKDRPKKPLLDYSIPKRKVDAAILLSGYSAGEIGEDAFFKDLACVEFFYSTAEFNLYSGDQERKTDYLPLFITKNDCIAYYEKAGKKDPVIVSKNFLALIESIIITNREEKPKEVRTTLKLGLVIDPDGHAVKYEHDGLSHVYFRMLRENDNFIQFKKAYLAAGIALGILLALFIGLIFVFRNVIDGLQPECQVAAASVINVDTKKDKVTVTSMGQTYVLKGVSGGSIFSYTSKQINGEQITVYIADGKAYPDYNTLKHKTSIYGKLLVVDYVAVFVLIFLVPLYFSCVYEAGKRERFYDILINE